MDIKEREGAEAPLPNLNSGHSVRAVFKETDVVVKPFVRDKEGLIREDLLRLILKSDRYSSFPQNSEWLTPIVPAVLVAPSERLASHLHSQAISLPPLGMLAV